MSSTSLHLRLSSSFFPLHEYCVMAKGTQFHSNLPHIQNHILPVVACVKLLRGHGVINREDYQLYSIDCTMSGRNSCGGYRQDYPSEPQPKSLEFIEPAELLCG